MRILSGIINFSLSLVIITFITGCTTPTTVLKNQQTGQVAICGGSTTGSLAGGMIGYHIQKSNDELCSEDYKKQGFTIIETRE